MIPFHTKVSCSLYQSYDWMTSASYFEASFMSVAPTVQDELKFTTAILVQIAVIIACLRKH